MQNGQRILISENISNILKLFPILYEKVFIAEVFSLLTDISLLLSFWSDFIFFVPFFEILYPSVSVLVERRKEQYLLSAELPGVSTRFWFDIIFLLLSGLVSIGSRDW